MIWDDSRIERVEEGFREHFGRDPQAVFSASGRTELGGNHTDHQRGHVLAAAVTLDVLAAVSPNGTNVVRFLSEGYPLIEVELDDLSMREAERETSSALVRGIASRMCELDADLDNAGFDAYAISDVPSGSGLSSSAAFEVLVGTIFDSIACDGSFSPVDIAQIGQFAENAYFGKPCGLMDQMASSVGGVVAMDLGDKDAPSIQKLDLDLESFGYGLCIIDSHASHEDLTDEYASVAQEMSSVAAQFGKEALSEVPEAEFLSALPRLRQKLGDRAVLRAMHFYSEDARAQEEAKAIEQGDFDRLLELVRESGRSSALYLQNVTPTGQVRDQSLLFVLALAEKLLEGRGAVRVHGGGFGGTAQAFVPLELMDSFKQKMDDVLGAGSCHVVGIRPVGGERVK